MLSLIAIVLKPDPACGLLLCCLRSATATEVYIGPLTQKVSGVSDKIRDKINVLSCASVIIYNKYIRIC